MPANTARRVPRSQSRVCSVRKMRRAGDERTANACCGDIAARNQATCVVDATRPRTRVASGIVNEGGGGEVGGEGGGGAREAGRADDRAPRAATRAERCRGHARKAPERASADD